jgi:hypothetical protein
MTRRTADKLMQARASYLVASPSRESFGFCARKISVSSLGNPRQLARLAW